MLKKIIIFAFCSVMLFGLTPVVSAADSYTGKSPYTAFSGYRCADDATTVSRGYITVNNAGGTSLGTIELRFSSRCQSAWARVTFNSALASGYTGNAKIQRFQGNTLVNSYTCDSSGGNGKVLAGQKSCYTPMVYDPVGYDARGIGDMYKSGNSYAWGYTNFY